MTRRRLLPALAVTVFCLAQIGFAQFISELNPFPRHFPTKGRFVVEFAKGGGGSNLVYHNGPVMPQAHVVPIFWGPSWDWR